MPKIYAKKQPQMGKNSPLSASINFYLAYNTLRLIFQFYELLILITQRTRTTDSNKTHWFHL